MPARVSSDSETTGTYCDRTPYFTRETFGLHPHSCKQRRNSGLTLNRLYPGISLHSMVATGPCGWSRHCGSSAVVMLVLQVLIMMEADLTAAVETVFSPGV